MFRFGRSVSTPSMTKAPAPFGLKNMVWLQRRPAAFLFDERIIVAARFQDRSIMKVISGGTYDGVTSTWSYPVRNAVAVQLRDGLPELAESPEFRALADSAWKQHQQAIIDIKHAPVPLKKTEEWGHQRGAFWFLMHREQGGLLDMWMGTGKSKVFIDLLNNRGARRVLIICPPSVMAVWPKQFSIHSFLEYEVVVLNEGSVAEKTAYAQRMWEWCDQQNKRLVVIINYESAWRPPFGPTRNGRNQIIDRGFAARMQWDIIGIDESHKIKNPTGVTSRFIRSLRNSAPYRVAMTGTPMPHSPLDIWSQANFLDPSVFGDNFGTFRKRIAVLGGYGGYEVKEWINQEWLARQISRFSYHVDADVLDLPPVQDLVRTVKINAKAQIIYKELEEAFFSELWRYVDRKENASNVTVTNVLVKLLRCQQVTSGYVKDDNGQEVQIDTAKQDALEDILDDIPATFDGTRSVREPVVVFARFEHDLRSIEAVCKKLKIKYKELSGNRKELASDATYPEDCDVFGVQVQAGGVGIDLTRACYAIYYSLDRSLGNYDQTRSRIHRPGQTRPTVYYHLVADHTVDVKIYEALEARRDLVQSLAQMMKRDQGGKLIHDFSNVVITKVGQPDDDYSELARAI